MPTNGVGAFAPIRRKHEPHGTECMVYGLTDPRTGLVRYIGSTERGVQRAYEHARNLKTEKNREKADWLLELQALGMAYGVVVLEECWSRYWVRVAEAQWIYRAMLLGMPLLNRRSAGVSKGKPSVLNIASTARMMSEEYGDMDRRIEADRVRRKQREDDRRKLERARAKRIREAEAADGAA